MRIRRTDLVDDQPVDLRVDGRLLGLEGEDCTSLAELPAVMVGDGTELVVRLGCQSGHPFREGSVRCPRRSRP